MRLRTVVLGTVVIVVAAISTALAVVLNTDFSQYRGVVQDKVKEATGPAGYDVWVGDDGYVHRVVVAQSSPKVSVTVDLSKFGDKVTAAAPPAAQVYESKNGSLPGLGGVGA